MKVIITEKPSVAKDIAKVLGVSDRKDGYFASKDTLITWAFGHLIQLADPDQYDPSYKDWVLATLPIIPETFQTEVGEDAGVQKQFATIKELLSTDGLTEVICATDAGREGELIFRYIYEKSGCKAPIKRLWISSQTDKAIKDGFAQLKPGADFVPLFHSAISRSEADWLVGINATRAYSLAYSYGSGVMSVGRVQTPVLKMIVDRYQENQRFIPETYFEIFADSEHKNGDFMSKWFGTGPKNEKTDRLQDRERAAEIVKKIKQVPHGEVLSIEEKDKKENQPLLYDLTELQKEANKKYKFSADKTLKLMQALYEQHKLLTYPRTSSRYLSKDLKPTLKGLLENLKSLPQYAPFIAPILEKEKLPISKRIIDDKKVTDHHAIIPTDKKPNLSALSEDEKRIYDVVIRRFIANFLPLCQKTHTDILCQFSEEQFKCTGTVIKDLGWRAVYQDESNEKTRSKKTLSEEELLLPKVKAGDTLKAKDVKLSESKTKAPQLHTEASILGAMETAGKVIEDEELRAAMKDCGLGTPATRAQILERLIKVQYIIREKNRLTPTEKGIKIISVIQNPELLSPEMTGDWEKKLNDISQNNYSRENYMAEIVDFTKRLIQSVHSQQSLKENLGTCPKCQEKVVETKLSYSCSTWKESGCSFVIWKTIAGRSLSLEEAKTLLEKGELGPLKGFKNKEGKGFEATLHLQDGKAQFKFQQESIGPCPLCDGEVVETPKAYSCSKWRETGCTMVIWKTIASRAIDKELATELVKNKRSTKLSGFKSRQGKNFETVLVLNNGKVQFDFN